MKYTLENGDANTKKIVSHIILASLLLVIVFGSIRIVGAGERGVRITLGNVEDGVLDEGPHFKLPIIQKIKVLDVKTQKYELGSLAYSKDIQTVDALIALNYHLTPDSVNKLWQEIGADYRTRIIDPAIHESIKVATAKFTAQELIEKRPLVKEEIRTELFNRLSDKHIVVDDFSIVNFDFSEAYENAVEAKQVAQQNALKAENDLKRIEVEAEQRIAQAKAEAEAIRIQAQAITQQGGREYVNLKWVEKWSGVLPQTMLGDAVPLVNIN